jgi:hypothetical protein
LHAAIARAILQSDNRHAVLQQCSHLVPVKLSDIPAPTLAILKQAHAITLETLRSVEAAILPYDGKDGGQASKANAPLGEDALLRLVLAVQMNAYQSGVYLQFSMVNHSCRPNCIKPRPAGGPCDPLANLLPFSPLLYAHAPPCMLPLCIVHTISAQHALQIMQILHCCAPGHV